MLFEKFPDLDTLDRERRAAVRQTLQSITLDELRRVTKEKLSEFEGDPWLEQFQRAIDAHQQGSFYRAVTPEGVILLYCSDEDIGIGVLPGSGMGPLPEQAKRDVKEALGHPFSGDKETKSHHLR
jgi:hypothetical protein